ncbi:hypothetical protein HDU93_005885 [Gonapodya sp. JEL0774]|nr:hypothetical protein HDU93_005885 [Gonapodya sp. JEL0774]
MFDLESFLATEFEYIPEAEVKIEEEVMCVAPAAVWHEVKEEEPVSFASALNIVEPSPDDLAAALAVLAQADPETLAALLAFPPSPSPSADSPSFPSPSPSAPASPPPVADTRTRLKIKSVEDLVQRTWLCPTPGCSWSFTRKHNLLNHMRLHNTDREISVCEHPGCGKEFSRKYDLERHARVHLGVKPFACGCGASYSRKDKLTQHLKSCDGVPRTDVKGKKGRR